MPKHKLIRITTVPISLEKLLEGQLGFMQEHYTVTAISADKEELEALGAAEAFATYHVEMTREITPLADIKSVYKLYTFLRKEKPTIVHTHTPKAGIVGMLASKLAGVPLRLHTVAGLPLMETTGSKRKLLDIVEKMTYALATKVYPNSKGLYDFIVEENLAKPKKLKIIGNGSSNGIDTDSFDPSYFSEHRDMLRKELGIAEDSFVFVFVGRLVGDKGINELVAAFGRLNARQESQELRTTNQESRYESLDLKYGRRDIRLLLVGPLETALDPLRDETLAAIGSNPNIISVGYQADVRPYFAAADALAFPSYREGFPNVVMQAGAMGLPCIVTDINGCNEIIIPEENGILIPPKDSEALLEAMQLLVDDSVLYAELKRNARARIKRRFERQYVWDALLKEYKFLLEGTENDHSGKAGKETLTSL